MKLFCNKSSNFGRWLFHCCYLISCNNFKGLSRCKKANPNTWSNSNILAKLVSRAIGFNASFYIYKSLIFICLILESLINIRLCFIGVCVFIVSFRCIQNMHEFLFNRNGYVDRHLKNAVKYHEITTLRICV